MIKLIISLLYVHITYPVAKRVNAFPVFTYHGSFTLTSFTTSPLRIATILAVPTFSALLVYFIYVIIKCLTYNIAIQAFQAIILLVLFFSGINIMLFGIIGEYLGRIFNESKHRPLYLVDEYNNKRETNEDFKTDYQE